ncbi:MAG: heme-dependent peroxidase [Acidobacteria bacterium]|nr:heme-dependent peroxidase [Acidobacteriota bacterium]
MSNPLTLPAVPLTIEGTWVLHQVFKFKQPQWGSLENLRKRLLIRELVDELHTWEENKEFPSAAFTTIGHKGDLMVIHFRKDPSHLHRVELELGRLSICASMEQVYSYHSVVEMGLYESTVKTYRGLAERGVAPHSDEWTAEIKTTIERQREAMAPRLFPVFPERKYVCFYPMDRLRGEVHNWYLEPIEERQRMMHDHGMIGRRYADDVKQIITGSIGLDDWEWGVDLFADDPLVFKRLIYEMRFDEVSAKYAKFGQFIVGLRVPSQHLEEVLVG